MLRYLPATLLLATRLFVLALSLLSLPGLVGRSQAQTVAVQLRPTSADSTVVGLAPYQVQVGPAQLLASPTQVLIKRHRAVVAQVARAEKNNSAAAQALAAAQNAAAAARTLAVTAAIDRQQTQRAVAAATRRVASTRQAGARARAQNQLKSSQKTARQRASLATLAEKQAASAAIAQARASRLLSEATQALTSAKGDSALPGQAARQAYRTDALVQQLHEAKLHGKLTKRLRRSLGKNNVMVKRLESGADSLPSQLLSLPPLALPVDLYEDTPYDIAQRVLRELRRAARSKAARRVVQHAPEWKPLLLPQANLLARKFTTGRRRARRMFLANVQTELERQIDAVANTSLAAKRPALPTAAASAGAPAAMTKPGTPAVAGPDVLYQREAVFATLASFNSTTSQAERRVLRLQLTDEGTTATPRYQLCVSYTTGSKGRGTFVNNDSPAPATGCPAPTDAVSATIRLSTLDRTLFVEKALLALNPANLLRTDKAPVDYQNVLSAQTAAAWQSQTERLADDTLRLRQTRLNRLAIVLAGLGPDSATGEGQALRTRRDTAKAAVNKAERLFSAQKQATIMAQKALDSALVAAKPSVYSAVKARFVLPLTPDDAGTTTLRETLTDFYLDYARQQTLLLAAPMAGVLDVLPQGDVYYPNVTRPHGSFVPDSVELEIEDGAILGLKATGRVESNGQKACFESRAPIGISSDRDLHTAWQHQRLWLQYPLLGHGPAHAAYVRLTDLLRYYPALAPEAGDRSPANGVYIVHRGDPLARRTFTKIAIQKILQGRIYSDLAGVSDRNPNGLVQLEVSRKFTFGTTWSKFSPNLQLQAFGYLVPFISINKLEQQNRYLPLARTAQPGIYDVHTIDLLRYTNFRVGAEYNLLGVRLARFKTDLALDFGAALSRVAIRDEAVVRRSAPTTPFRVDSTLNVGSYGLSLKFRVRPDSRYGLVVRFGYFRYTLFNDRDNDLFISQQPTATAISSNGNGLFGQFIHRYWFEGVMQYELTGRLKIGENAEYFIRPQLSHLLYQSNRTYFQLQTGFQFDVFGPRHDAPPGVSLPIGIATKKTF